MLNIFSLSVVHTDACTVRKQIVYSKWIKIYICMYLYNSDGHICVFDFFNNWFIFFKMIDHWQCDQRWKEIIRNSRINCGIVYQLTDKVNIGNG